MTEISEKCTDIDAIVWRGVGCDYSRFRRGILRFRLQAQACECDLGSIEEMLCIILHDRAGEDTIGYAGDEVTDILMARQRGQGAQKGSGGLGAREVVVAALFKKAVVVG